MRIVSSSTWVCLTLGLVLNVACQLRQQNCAELDYYQSQQALSNRCQMYIEQAPGTPVLRDAARDVASLLAAMPSWIVHEPGNAQGEINARLIESVCRSIDELESEAIVLGMQAYQASGGWDDDRPFLVNQFLFDLPTDTVFVGIYPFEPWLYKRDPTAQVTTVTGGIHITNPRWPWRQDDQGRRRLLEGNYSFFTGPPYDAVAAFRAMESRFGRRHIARSSIIQ